MYILKYLYHISSLCFNAIINLSKTARTGKQYIHFIQAKYDCKLEKSAFEKAAKFQSIQQILINDHFAALYGRSTNQYEQESNRLYFIMSGLYDDIVDNKLLSEKALDQLFEHPELANQANSYERLLAIIHLKLLSRVNEIEKYQLVLSNIHQAQKDSLQQFDKQISLDEIQSITLRKGGNSLLMCRHYLNLKGSENMDDCWYLLGGIIQMTNDLFDIYKDLQAGIYTFANTVNSCQSIKTFYDEQVAQFKQAVYNLDYSKAKKQKLLNQLSIIPAFGYIAIENLAIIQNGQNTLPDLNLLTKKQLIIDMEKFKNIVKLLKYSYFVAHP